MRVGQYRWAELSFRNDHFAPVTGKVGEFDRLNIRFRSFPDTMQPAEFRTGRAEPHRLMTGLSSQRPLAGGSGMFQASRPAQPSFHEKGQDALRRVPLYKTVQHGRGRAFH